MARGTIAKLMKDRGFGFIRGSDGKDLFFHRTGLVDVKFDDLVQGTVVEFEVQQGPKGLRAGNIRIAAAS